MNAQFLYGPIVLPALGVLLLAAVLFRMSRSALLIAATEIQ